LATIICGFDLKERILLDPVVSIGLREVETSTATYRRWRDKGVFEIGLINFIQAIIRLRYIRKCAIRSIYIIMHAYK